MLKSVVVAGVLVLGVGIAEARAQGVEASIWGGWVFSDGVSVSTPVLGGDGNVYSRVDPKDSSVFGVNVGFFASESAEIGFMYSRQFSTLLFGGTADREVGDLNVDTYHGYFSYDFAMGEGRIRPFALIGFGATNYSQVDVTLVGVNRSLPGDTRFSTTWAAGVKFFAGPRVGARAMVRWTPTYIKSDPGGWWCDPFWGCYLAGDPQYSNQFEISGGVTFRFVK